MTYKIFVEFEREESDDFDVLEIDHDGPATDDDRRALVKQFVKELQAAYDETFLAGQFQVKAIEIDGVRTDVKPRREFAIKLTGLRAVATSEEEAERLVMDALSAVQGLDTEGAEAAAHEHSDEYTHEPDDGHEHDFVLADFIDTGTDNDAVICTKCGLLSAVA